MSGAVDGAASPAGAAAGPVGFGHHLDDDGQPCARHGVPVGSLFQLALVGSRAPAFHHDCASKLQGLVMALDEAIEIAETATDPHLMRALDTAQTATRELHALLNLSRSLARPPAATTTTVRELVTRAGERVSVIVQWTGPDAPLEVAVPAMIQALALAIDIAAGTGRSRTLAVEASLAAGDRRCTLVIPRVATPAPPNADEALAIAAFVFARERGELRCSVAGDRLTIRL